MRGGALALAALLALAGAAPATGQTELRAGAAAARFAVPAGTPLAGYGSFRRRLVLPDLLGLHPHAFWFRPHQGVLDPPGVRALVLETPGARLAWAALDVVAVDRAFVETVRARLAAAGVPPATLVLSASHTHSGPGAFLDSWLMALVATDRLEPAVRDGLAAGVVTAIRQANAAKVPAHLGAAEVEAPDVVTSRLDLPVDRRIVVLRVETPAGAPIAALWNFAIHGTMLGPGNLSLSGDVTGVAVAELERRLGVPVLYVNGAVGDVSPRHHGLRALEAAGRALAAAAADAWRQARPRAADRLRLGAARAALPPPRLALRACLGRWLPAGWTLPLDEILPTDAELVAGRVGDVAWVTIPGELQTRLGLAIKAAAPADVAHPMVAGVSNGYLGYFLGAAEADRIGYVSCASLYGRQAGERLARTAAGLLQSLGAERSAGTEAQR